MIRPKVLFPLEMISDHCSENGTTHEAAFKMGTKYCASSSDMPDACP